MARVLSETEHEAYNQLLYMHRDNEEEQWRIREKIEVDRVSPTTLLELEKKKILELRAKSRK